MRATKSTATSRTSVRARTSASGSTRTASASIDRYAEQLWDGLFAKAPEQMLFNWSPMAEAKPATAGERPWAKQATSFEWTDRGRERLGERGERGAAHRRRRARTARQAGRRRELPAAARDRRGLPPQLHRQPRRADRALSRISGDGAHDPADAIGGGGSRTSSPRSRRASRAARTSSSRRASSRRCRAAGSSSSPNGT